MKNIVRLILLLAFILPNNSATAQLNKNSNADDINNDSPKHLDVLYLRDGSILKGKIIHWKYDEDIQFKLVTGSEITLPNNQVFNVKQILLSPAKWERRKAMKDISYNKKGLYNNLALSFPMGSQLGVSLTYALGHRFNRWVGLGVGLGIEDFETDDAAQIVPIFAELRGHLNESHISPYYSLRLGYGIPLVNESFRIVEANGGLMAHPEVGFRFGGRDVRFYVGAGIRFQNAEYVREIPWLENGFERIDVTYKRIDLKFGMEF